MSSTRRFAICGTAAVLLAFAAPSMAQEGLQIDSAVIDLIIESRLQKPAAQATPAERESALDEAKSIFAVTNLPRAEELADERYLKAQLELSRRVMLFQAVAADYIANNPASDQEIFDLYEQQVVQAPNEQYKAKHILVETQGEAIGIIQALNDGAEFNAQAQAHSLDSSASSGGDLGWFSPEQMVKPFSDAVIALGNGEYTKSPVQSQFGWHVILREDSKALEPPTLESMRDSLKQTAEARKFQDYMEKVREEADQ